jgi:type IV pilus assembly protein PilZ
MNEIPPKQGEGVLFLSIRDLGVLHASYMPFIKHGGLFVPTHRAHQLGDEIFILLHLMNEPERFPIVGKVVWITPLHAESHKPQGIGIQFAGEEGRVIKERIEVYLAGFKDSERPTQTC